MVVHGSGAAEIVDHPNAGQKLITTEYPVQIFHQELQKMIFHPGQVHSCSFNANLVYARIQGYFAESKHVARRLEPFALDQYAQALSRFGGGTAHRQEVIGEFVQFFAFQPFMVDAKQYRRQSEMLIVYTINPGFAGGLGTGADHNHG